MARYEYDHDMRQFTKDGIEFEINDVLATLHAHDGMMTREQVEKLYNYAKEDVSFSQFVLGQEAAYKTVLNGGTK